MTHASGVLFSALCCFSALWWDWVRVSHFFYLYDDWR